jgi:CheY-like chemotaxis protein
MVALHNSKRILVVDDEPDTLNLLEALFTRWGFEVSTARNGAEALTCCEQARPDVVLTDLAMPEMDGVELCRRLKARPDLRLIPILVASGLPQLPVALHLAVEAFFPKPLDCWRLLSAVDFYVPAD